MREVLGWLAAPTITALSFFGLLVASLSRAIRSEHRSRMTAGIIAATSISWLILAALNVWGPDLAGWSPIALLFLVLLHDNQSESELAAAMEAQRELKAQAENQTSEAVLGIGSARTDLSEGGIDLSKPISRQKTCDREALGRDEHAREGSAHASATGAS